MEYIISAAVLALIQNSGVQAINHRHQVYGASRGSARGHTKDIGMENIDPWVYDMVNPEVESTAWGRPAEAPARKSYTPYSSVKPELEAAPEKADKEPAELVGLYQYGKYRAMYANPDGSMLIFTSDGEEPAKEEAAEPAKEAAAEGKEEKKEEKKAAEEEVVEGEDLEAKKPDLSDPTRNNVVADGNSWTMKMSDAALDRDTPFPLKWAN